MNQRGSLHSRCNGFHRCASRPPHATGLLSPPEHLILSHHTEDCTYRRAVREAEVYFPHATVTRKVLTSIALIVTLIAASAGSRNTRSVCGACGKDRARPKKSSPESALNRRTLDRSSQQN